MELAVQSFDQIANELSSILRKQGIVKQALSDSRPLARSPLLQQRRAFERASLQLRQMEMTSTGNLEEFEKLRVLCHYHKVQPVDASVFALISKNSAWEIIDFNLNQLYRNDLIFKLGNYSIEDYESFSPWELFDRPQSVLSALAETTKQLKDGKRIVCMEHMPEYVIEETKTPERAQYKIKHHFACPLESTSRHENTMFVSSFELEALDPRLRVSLF